MKRTFFFALASLLMLGFVACDKDNDKNNGGSGNNSAILGDWQVDVVTYNGEDISAMMGSVVISFYADGRGLINHNGETQHNDFGWSISGSTITVTPHNGNAISYSIVTLTATECSFTGTVVPMTETTGDVKIHMVKVGGGNGGGFEPNPDPVTGTLENTRWGYHLETSRTEGSAIININGNIKLAFNTTTEGILAEDVEVTMEMNGIPIPGTRVTFEAPYTYTYDVASHTGSLTATVYNEETRQDETEVITFVYDPAQNVIIATNTDYNPDEDVVPQTITLMRIR